MLDLWKYTDREELKHSDGGGTLSQYHLLQHKYEIDLPGNRTKIFASVKAKS
jgi:hypothetical protein